MTSTSGLSDESTPLLPEDITAILQFLPRFEKSDFSPGSVHDEKGQFPWFDYSPCVMDFRRALYSHKFVVLFDWGSWQHEAEDYYRHPERLATADMPTLRRLLTVHMRKDRFCEGHLAGMFESGQIVAILHRVRDLATIT